MKASKIQVGGDHYKVWKIQPFEFFVKNHIPFHRADIIKRIMRYDLPSGKGLEDLKKIKHEVDLIIEWEDFNDLPLIEFKISKKEFCEINQLPAQKRAIIWLILGYHILPQVAVADLLIIKNLIDEIIEKEYNENTKI